MLRHPRVTDEVAGTTRRADWAHGVRGCLTWGIPVTLLVLSPERYFVIVWPGVLPLGTRGWSTLSVALVIGSAILLCVPEWILGRYRSSVN
jgi:hypothetical protein